MDGALSSVVVVPSQICTSSSLTTDRKPCRLYSADNDMDPGSVPAELQGLSEVEELLIARAFPIMYIYRKRGGQRGYKGNVLNLPEDIQGFLNSLPLNVGGLPILVIRKQGAGKCLLNNTTHGLLHTLVSYCMHAFHFDVKTLRATVLYVFHTAFILCAAPIIQSEL